MNRRRTNARGLNFVSNSNKKWGEVLDWAEKYFGQLVVSEGIMPAPQPKETLQKIAGKVKNYDDFELAVAVDGAGNVYTIVLVHVQKLNLAPNLNADGACISKAYP